MHCCSFVHVGILAVYPYLNLRKNRMWRFFSGQRDRERQGTVLRLSSFWEGDEEPSPVSAPFGEETKNRPLRSVKKTAPEPDRQRLSDQGQ